MKAGFGWAALAAGMALAGSAVAQDPPEALVWMALNEINSDYFDRAEPMNRPPIVTEVPDGMLTAVDVSHDGIADWLVSYDEAGSGWCGTGWCLKTLYVSTDADNYVMAFDEQALDFAVVERDGETRVLANVHHTFCVPDNWDCQYAYAWDETLMRLVERPNGAGITLLRGGGMDPLGNNREPNQPRDDMPEDIALAWWATRMTCQAYIDDGFETRRAEVWDVADLNGDGVRDWIFQRPSVCQDNPDMEVEQPGFQVWLSGEGGTFMEAYQSEPNHWVDVDIARTPAYLISNPACGYGEECPNQRMSWDAGQERFVPVR